MYKVETVSLLRSCDANGELKELVVIILDLRQSEQSL
jgi:hypothetical protein